MRRGDADALSLLLEAKSMSFENMELQRIIPALVTLLEYEWLTGKTVINPEDIHLILDRINESINNVEKNEFAHWLLKSRNQHLPLEKVYKRYEVSSVAEALKAAGLWAKLGCPYEEALALFEGNDINKRKAIKIIHELGAIAVYDKMKLEMRASGIKNIPRGIRKSTQLNPAFLTARELDVLQLLKDGLQNKEIGNKLYISPKTVDHHISAIFFKLDVKTRMKAVAEAKRQKILE
jgi:DNA-binding CsgD family transcriptional regulator